MRARVGTILLVLYLSLVALNSQAAEVHPGIGVLKVKGAINPVTASYVNRGLQAAEANGAALVILQLDTPGGLDSSMRDMVQRIVESRVPVVVYVSPAGGRAASAGMFITMAAHVAAMAPNTAIGAAHPVGGPGQELSGVMQDKATNDAVAYVRSIAQQHQRNADWAEQAVRQSVSATSEDALKLGVVELLAPDVPTLIQQLDGREINLLTGRVTLHTAGGIVYSIEMNLIERFLFAISDPNIAYLLLSLAMMGLFFELSNPGSIFPGVVGGICLLLALFALGMLPVNLAGLLLIALAFLLFLAEIWVTSHGLLTVGGIIALTFGSLILISSTDPYFAIDRRLIGAVVVTLSGFFFFVVTAIVKAQRRRAVTGWEGLVGETAVARSALAPEGLVFLHGERWQAIAANGPVAEGDVVRVTGVDGLRLRVSKVVK